MANNANLVNLALLFWLYFSRQAPKPELKYVHNLDISKGNKVLNFNVCKWFLILTEFGKLSKICKLGKFGSAWVLKTQIESPTVPVWF